MPRTAGFPFQFRRSGWESILDAVGRNPALSHLAPIVESISASPARDALAGALWMHDLAVASMPVGEPPIDVILVQLLPSTGLVRIQHLTVSGRNDTIERPIDASVPLFWRFAIEKFGVSPS